MIHPVSPKCQSGRLAPQSMQTKQVDSLLSLDLAGRSLSRLINAFAAIAPVIARPLSTQAKLELSMCQLLVNLTQPAVKSDSTRQAWLCRYAETWVGYITMLVGAGNVDQARRVYKRASARALEENGRLLLCEAWLRFEREHGTADSLAEVGSSAATCNTPTCAKMLATGRLFTQCHAVMLTGCLHLQPRSCLYLVIICALCGAQLRIHAECLLHLSRSELLPASISQVHKLASSLLLLPGAHTDCDPGAAVSFECSRHDKPMPQ